MSSEATERVARVEGITQGVPQRDPLLFSFSRREAVGVVGGVQGWGEAVMKEGGGSLQTGPFSLGCLSTFPYS